MNGEQLQQKLLNATPAELDAIGEGLKQLSLDVEIMIAAKEDDKIIGKYVAEEVRRLYEVEEGDSR